MCCSTETPLAVHFDSDYDRSVFRYFPYTILKPKIGPRLDKKMFISSPNVNNGDWVQVFGEGSFNRRNLNLHHFVHKSSREEGKARCHSDRCPLSKDECATQCKSTDENYHWLHEPLDVEYDYDHVIKMKWE